MKNFNFKLLFFIFILLICPCVFADTSYNMTSLITSPVNFPECGVGSYTGVELNGATNCWNTNTRYQGTLNRIYFNLPAPTGTTFEPDTAYRLTLNMATQDWRNNFGTVVVSPGSNYTNNFVDTFTFVSMKQVNITFTVPYSGSTTYQFLYVNLPAKNSSSLITGTSNWNLSNVTLTKLTSGSGGGSSTPSGPTTTFDDTAIINSDKENTQDIINNNNNNTQDVINNNNSNTQQILDSQNEIQNSLSECTGNKNNLLSGTSWTNGYIIEGNVGSASTNTLSDYILISGYSHLTITTNTNFYNIAYALYNSNKDFIRAYDNYQSNRVLVNVPSNATYIRVWFNYNNSTNTINTINDFDVDMYNYYCSSKLDETNAAINNSTNTIINNQNENTNKQIESEKVCSIIDISDVVNNGYLSNSGQVNAGNSTAYGITDYIKISSNDSITVTKSTGETFNYCFYTSSKTVISCTRSSNNSVNSSIPIPSNATYIRFSIRRNINTPQYYICRNGNQVMNESINDINNSINNSNVDSDTGTGFFDNFTSEDFGLSQIITIPLNTIQSLTSKSCSPLSVPIPFTNSSVDLPCMTQIYESKFSSIYNLWKIVSFGIVAYLIAIDIFHIVKGFKDPESDKVEVLDL